MSITTKLHFPTQPNKPEVTAYYEKPEQPAVFQEAQQLLDELENIDFAQTLEQAGTIFHRMITRIISTLEQLNQVTDVNRPSAIEISLDLGDALNNLLFQFDGNPAVIAEPSTVLTLYETIFQTQIPILRDSLIDNLDTIIRLDRNHTPADQQLHLQDRVLNDIAATFATSPVGDELQNTLCERLADAVGAYEWIAPLAQLAPQSLTIAHTQNIPLTPAFVRVANIYGFEETRKMLRNHVTVTPDFEPILQKLNHELEITPALAQLFNDLADLYRAIDFSEYTPNQELQDTDNMVLRDRLAETEIILDVGMGPNARNLIPLAKEGKRMFGIDLVDEHIANAKAELKKANIAAEVQTASWDKTPFQDGFFDGAYILGRSFLHNTNVQDAIACLREMARILKPGGRLIIDLPDCDQGDYATNRERIQSRATELGITKIQIGTIIDSPDGTSYFDRLVPTKEQFIAIAAASGFEAQLAHEQNYVSTNGTPDTNTYWLLTKTSSTKKINLEELFQIAGNLDTSGMPVRIATYK